MDVSTASLSVLSSTEHVLLSFSDGLCAQCFLLGLPISPSPAWMKIPSSVLTLYLVSCLFVPHFFHTILPPSLPHPSLSSFLHTTLPLYLPPSPTCQQCVCVCVWGGGLHVGGRGGGGKVHVHISAVSHSVTFSFQYFSLFSSFLSSSTTDGDHTV